jgi:sugar/nucleoside kinase (ribokinase family)
MLDVLMPAAYFCDLIFTGLPEMPRLGDEVFCRDLRVMPGAGFIPAVALTRLGLQVGWACDFGNDFFSRYVLEEAARQQLSPRLFQVHDSPQQAVTVAYSFSHERAFLSYMDPLPSSDLAALVRRNPSRWLLIMSLEHGPDFARAVGAARESGTQVFMDCQAFRDASLDDPGVVQALKSVDVFVPNQEEALRLTGKGSIESALECLSAFTPLVVIKLGAEGAIARRGDKLLRLPGIPARAVDTTGAGDNFDCGFLYGLLQGYSLEECVRCGNFCGSRSTTAHGGWAASPTANDLEAYLQSNPDS